MQNTNDNNPIAAGTSLPPVTDSSLSSLSGYDTLDSEIGVLESLLEDTREMKRRKEILKKHKPEIQYLETEDRWYTRIDGKLKRRKNKKDLEDDVVRAFREKEKGPETLRTIYPRAMEQARLELEPRTIAKFEGFWQRLFLSIEELTDKPLDQLTLADGYTFFMHCTKVTGGMRRKYWGNICAFTNRLFRFATANGLIEKNPWENVAPARFSFMPKDKPKKGSDIFSRTEVQKVCSLAKNDFYRTGKGMPLSLILLAGTGLRIGELCALRWSDIEDNMINVSRKVVPNMDEHYHMDGYKIDEYPKTDAGVRTIPLNKECQEILKQLKEANEENGYPVGKSDLIFWRTYHGQKQPCSPRSIDHKLRVYCKEADMEEIKSAHDMRRTAITRLYESKLPLSQIQQIAGHSSIKQTLDYLRIADDDIDVFSFMESLTTTKSPKIVDFKPKEQLSQDNEKRLKPA